MSIAVTCQCGESFRVKDEYAGKKGKCPACGHTLFVPRQSDAVAVKAASPPPRPKQSRCSQCGAGVEPQNGIIEEGGRIICPRCFGGSPIGVHNRNEKSSAKLLIVAVVSGITILLAAIVFVVLYRNGNRDHAASIPKAGLENQPRAVLVGPDSKPIQPSVGQADKSATTREPPGIGAKKNTSPDSVSREPQPPNANSTTEIIRKEIRQLAARGFTTFASAHTVDELRERQEGILANGVLNNWSAALQVDRDHTYSFLITYRPLFDKNGLLQPAVASRYLDRAKLVPNDAIGQWYQTLASLYPTLQDDGAATKITIIGLLLAQDRLFATGAFLKDQSDELRSRLSSIPRQAIKRFAVAIAPEHEKVDVPLMLEIYVAVSLSQLDSLFDQHRFQPQAFEIAFDEVATALPKEDPAPPKKGELTDLTVLGATTEELKKRLSGPESNTPSAEFPGATSYTFLEGNARITAIVFRDKCGQVEYASKDGSDFPAPTVDHLLAANSDGLRWQRLELGGSPKWIIRSKVKGRDIFRTAFWFGNKSLTIEDPSLLPERAKQKTP